MATLQIRKKAEKVFVHVPSDQAEFIISKFYISIDGLEFQVVEQGQSKRNKYLLSDITVYDDTVGGSAETFTTIEELSERLVALKYNGFYNENESLFNAFTDLVDTPSSYTGQGGKVVAVKSDASGLEFITGGGGGSTPTLQDVLDENNQANESIILTDGIDTTSINKGSIDLQFDDTLGSGDNFVIQRNAVGETLFSNLETGKSVLMRIAIPTGNGELNYPDVGNNIETIATREWVNSNLPTIDANPTDGSSNAVSSNGVFDALALKANKPLVDTVSSSALTGVTTEGILKTYLIPANTLTSSEILNFANDLYKTGTAGTVTSRLYTNTSASLSGALLLATNISTAGSRKIILRRQLVFKSGNVEVLNATSSTPDDNINSGTVATIVTFNPTVDNYLITTAQNANAGDSTIQNNLKIYY